jgi:hypothetical protein
MQTVVYILEATVQLAAVCNRLEMSALAVAHDSESLLLHSVVVCVVCKVTVYS